MQANIEARASASPFFSEGGTKGEVDQPKPLQSATADTGAHSRRSRERMVSSHTGHSQAIKKQPQLRPNNPSREQRQDTPQTMSQDGVREWSERAEHHKREHVQGRTRCASCNPCKQQSMKKGENRLVSACVCVFVRSPR